VRALALSGDLRSVLSDVEDEPSTETTQPLSKSTFLSFVQSAVRTGFSLERARVQSEIESLFVPPGTSDTSQGFFGKTVPAYLAFADDETAKGDLYGVSLIDEGFHWILDLRGRPSTCLRVENAPRVPFRLTCRWDDLSRSICGSQPFLEVGALVASGRATVEMHTLSVSAFETVCRVMANAVCLEGSSTKTPDNRPAARRARWGTSS
jgi:hypothetical protein